MNVENTLASQMCSCSRMRTKFIHGFSHRGSSSRLRKAHFSESSAIACNLFAITDQECGNTLVMVCFPHS